MAKATKTAKKPARKRANKYEEKLQLNGTFEETMKELITHKTPAKKK